MNNLISIYTKVCLPCVMREDWKDLQRAIWNAGYNIETLRTTYDKGLHERATKLWGDDNYVAFAVMPNGDVQPLGKAKKMLENIKDKRVKAGKTKPVRKGKKNVQGLRKTERPIRVDSVEDSPVEIEIQNQTR